MKSLMLVFIFALGLSGCSARQQTVSVPGKVPTIEAAVKPTLEKLTPEELEAYKALPESARTKIELNDKKLKIYGEQNAESIREYNLFAKFRNSASDEFVIGKKEEK